MSDTDSIAWGFGGFGIKCYFFLCHENHIIYAYCAKYYSSIYSHIYRKTHGRSSVRITSLNTLYFLHKYLCTSDAQAVSSPRDIPVGGIYGLTTTASLRRTISPTRSRMMTASRQVMVALVMTLSESLGEELQHPPACRGTISSYGWNEEHQTPWNNLDGEDVSFVGYRTSMWTSQLSIAIWPRLICSTRNLLCYFFGTINNRVSPAVLYYQWIDPQHLTNDFV